VYGGEKIIRFGAIGRAIGIGGFRSVEYRRENASLRLRIAPPVSGADQK
jgi:hypothetical protein